MYTGLLVDIKVEQFGSKTVLASVCMSVNTFLTIIGDWNIDPRP
jgi:hypothetical protein